MNGPTSKLIIIHRFFTLFSLNLENNSFIPLLPSRAAVKRIAVIVGLYAPMKKSNKTKGADSKGLDSILSSIGNQAAHDIA
jgi:hypothetical protein